MKKIFTFFTVILLIFTMLPISALAAGDNSSKSIVYLEDGSYIVIEITEISTRATSSKSANKSQTYYNSNGKAQWTAIVTGTFTYTGTTSTCTASSCSVNITDSSWYIISNTASKSGNSAIANFTMGKRFLGIKINEESLTLKLTCDANGNLS